MPPPISAIKYARIEQRGNVGVNRVDIASRAARCFAYRNRPGTAQDFQ